MTARHTMALLLAAAGTTLADPILPAAESGAPPLARFKEWVSRPAVRDGLIVAGTIVGVGLGIALIPAVGPLFGVTGVLAKASIGGVAGGALAAAVGPRKLDPGTTTRPDFLRDAALVGATLVGATAAAALVPLAGPLAGAAGQVVKLLAGGTLGGAVARMLAASSSRAVPASGLESRAGSAAGDGPHPVPALAAAPVSPATKPRQLGRRLPARTPAATRAAVAASMPLPSAARGCDGGPSFDCLQLAH